MEELNNSIGKSLGKNVPNVEISIFNRKKKASLQTGKVHHVKLDQSTKDGSDIASSVITAGLIDLSNLETVVETNENLKDKISARKNTSMVQAKHSFTRSPKKSNTIKLQSKISFTQMPGNERRRPTRKKLPELQIIDKTIVEPKTFIAPQLTTIVKSQKYKDEQYPKDYEFKNITKNIKENNLITKYYRPKVHKKLFNEEGELEKKDFEQEEESSENGSFVRLEFPIQVVQKEIIPPPQPILFDEKSKIDVFLEQVYRPENLVEHQFAFTLEKIRTFVPTYEPCNYDDQLDEIYENVRNDKKELTDKQKYIPIVTKDEISSKVEPHDFHKNIYDHDILLLPTLSTLPTRASSKTVSTNREDNSLNRIKMCIHEKIKEIKVEMQEIEDLLMVPFEEYRQSEEKSLRASSQKFNTRNQSNFFQNDSKYNMKTFANIKEKIILITKHLMKKGIRYKNLVNKLIQSWKDLNNNDPKLNDAITAEKLGDYSLNLRAKDYLNKDNNYDNEDIVEDDNVLFNFKIHDAKSANQNKHEYFHQMLKSFLKSLKNLNNFEIKKEFVIDNNSNNTNKLVCKVNLESSEIKFYESGQIDYKNKWNTTIKLCPDGFVTFIYKNGDIKQCYNDGQIVNYFAKNLIIQSECFQDGYKIKKFKDNHIEQIYYDGFIAIRNVDKSYKLIDSVYGEHNVTSLD